MTEPIDIKAKLAEKIAATRRRERLKDPYGFHGMTERELEDWLGSGHAEVGSTVYEQAKTILEGKRTRRLLVDGLDSQPEDRAHPEEREATEMTGVHVAILGLIAAVLFGASALAGSVWVGIGATALLVVALAVEPIRAPLLRAIDRVTGSGGR